MNSLLFSANKIPNETLLQLSGPIDDLVERCYARYPDAEADLRRKTACAYRLVDLLGWTEGIYGHISTRTDDDGILLNPFGLFFHEVTASSLLKVDLSGKILDPGSTNFGFNNRGYTLHSAIHGARPDIRCAIHLHTPEVLAFSSLQRELLPMWQENNVIGDLSYHPFHGVLQNLDERQEIVKNLAQNMVMILKQHGFVCCGKSVEEAFHRTYYFLYAIKAQLKMCSVAPEKWEPCNLDVYEKGKVSSPLSQGETSGVGKDGKPIFWPIGEMDWEAWMRLLEKMLTSKLQLKLSGFKSTRVLYFTNGSVHTHMELIAEGHTTEEIMAALANEVHSSNNRIADLKVDPDSIQVQKAEATVNANAELMRNYIIIGVACVLVLITLIIGICFCVKNRLAKTDMAVNGGSYAPYGTPYHYPTMGQVPDAKPVIGHQHSSSDGYVYSNEVYNNARLGTQLASSVGGPGGKGGAKSSSPESETKKRLKLNNSSSSPSSEEGDHNGRGPTTLNEWYQRVGNENSPQTNHNGSQQSGRRESLNMDTRPMLPPGAHPVGPRRVLAPGAVAGPYVQYPNDPYSYYTMNGHNRIMAMRGGVMPPPAGYYRPY